MRRFLRPAPTCAIPGTGPVRAEHGHDPDAYVEIGSLTKALTGTLLARPADAGRLAPDDRLTVWLPAVPAGSEITLRAGAGPDAPRAAVTGALRHRAPRGCSLPDAHR
ncbi:serine hydrolase [Streptomyces sp. NPDC093591]|uniref:serine hydrolase n=1 Tax=Streptomyces sp. NPDC093591 TaxID=3366044 RepID=UPI00380A8E27